MPDADLRVPPVAAVARPAPGPLLTASILLVSAMTIMANATIAPSLPDLRAHYADVPGIETLAGLILTLPSLAIVLSAGLMGWLADTVSRQWLLAASGLLYALGGTSGLWVDSLPALLAGRIVLGVGVAGTMILATTWAADLWQGPARERFLGRQGASMSAGGIVVIVLGGALATLGWRGAFATYLLVVPVTLLALWTLAPHARARADRPAVVAGGGAMPWRLFAFVGSLAFLFMLAFYVMPTRGPFFLEGIGVESPFVKGLMLAGMTLFSIPGALGYGRLRRVLSPMSIFAASWLVMAAGLGIVAWASTPAVAFLGIAVLGVGMGPSLPNYTTYWMNAVPAPLRGRASGLLTAAFFAGQFVSPLATAPLVAAAGLHGAFAWLAGGMAVLGLGLSVVARRG